MRKRVFASRPARKKGSREWLQQQLDASGFQERELKIAYFLYKDAATRAGICNEFRRTRVHHRYLPLMQISSKPPCTDTLCTCKPGHLR